jgi:hypothetical protein
MKSFRKISWGVILLALFGSTANAALLSRAGGQAYYDTVLDITWIANANLAASNTFGVGGIGAGGNMSWGTANSWIAAMNAANYLGVNNWRLPGLNPINGSSFNLSTSYNGSTDIGYNVSESGTAYAGSTASEMAHLYYNTLDNKGYCTPTDIYPTCNVQSGWGLANTGPFSNIQSGNYWTGHAALSAGPHTNPHFNFGNGYQDDSANNYSNYAWAVSAGDSAAVPVPAAVWLFGSALGVLGAVRRKLRG